MVIKAFGNRTLPDLKIALIALSVLIQRGAEIANEKNYFTFFNRYVPFFK